MTIRSASLTDLTALTNLFEGYRIFYRKDPNLKGAKEFISARLTEKDSIIYVCENTTGELLGFVQLYPLFSSTRMKKLWLLNDLFIKPDARGKGVSKLLIEQAKHLALKTNAAGLLLETEVSNKIGNQLYPNTGFKLIDSSNFYEWTNPEG